MKWFYILVSVCDVLVSVCDIKKYVLNAGEQTTYIVLGNIEIAYQSVQGNH